MNFWLVSVRRIESYEIGLEFRMDCSLSYNNDCVTTADGCNNVD